MAATAIWLPAGFSFISGLPEAARRRRVLLPIQVFVDDSSGGTVLAMAGFSAAAEDWASFSDEWRRVLAEPPALPYLKMSEATRLRGRFYGWSPQERDEKLRRLVQVFRLARGGFRAIFNVMDLQGFGETYALHLPRPLNHPYFWAYQYLMVAASRDMRDSGYSGRCEIIFDEQVIFAPRVQRWYRVIRRCVEDDIRAIMPNEPLFRDDMKFIPLQAADMLAGLVRKHFDGADDPLGWLVGELGTLVEISRRSQEITKEKMAAVVAEFPQMDDLAKAYRALLDLLGETE